MSHQSIKPLEDHAVYEVANILALFLGIDRDWISLVQLLSLAAGRMAMPINLDVVSDQVAIDRMIADRVCNIVPGKCIPIDTHKSFWLQNTTDLMTSMSCCAAGTTRNSTTTPLVIWRRHPTLQKEPQAFGEFMKR